MAILDHLCLNVRDYERSKAFYEAALKPLGITLLAEYGIFGGFGRDDKPEFWIGEGKMAFQEVADLARVTPIHVAFLAGSRAEVDAFYEAAIAAGAQDNGKPGLRPQYHPDYYGAFVLDLNGHNVEAVCHKAE